MATSSAHAEKRTPMAWQHRDMNYHQSGFHDRYGGPSMNAMHSLSTVNPGPSSMSDRVSHRTDKSWRTQKDTHVSYPGSNRPSYSTGRQPSRTNSPSSSSTTSSTESDTEREENIRDQINSNSVGYPATAGIMSYPSSVSHYPDTIKSAKSVPGFGTWDGEPCPVHHHAPVNMPPFGPMSLPGPIGPQPILIPMQGPRTLPGKRSGSVYDMRFLGLPQGGQPGGPIYGTLPTPLRLPAPLERRMISRPVGMPSQFLPPMSRPRPLVLSEDGNTEPLPVRSPEDKLAKSSLDISAKEKESKNKKLKHSCPGLSCVGIIVMGVISAGLLLGILLVYIL